MTLLTCKLNLVFRFQYHPGHAGPDCFCLVSNQSNWSIHCQDRARTCTQVSLHLSPESTAQGRGIQRLTTLLAATQAGAYPITRGVVLRGTELHHTAVNGSGMDDSGVGSLVASSGVEARCVGNPAGGSSPEHIPRTVLE